MQHFPVGFSDFLKKVEPERNAFIQHRYIVYCTRSPERLTLRRYEGSTVKITFARNRTRKLGIRSSIVIAEQKEKTAEPSDILEAYTKSVAYPYGDS